MHLLRIKSSHLQVLRYLGELLRGCRLQAVLNTLIGLLLVALDLLFVWTTKYCIDIATHSRQPWPFMPESHPLVGGVAILLLIILTQLALSVCLRWIRALLGVKAQNQMQRHLLGKLLGTCWTDFRATHSAGYTNRLERDVKDVMDFVTESVPSLITTVSKFVGSFCLLFYMDRALALIVCSLLPFFLLCSRLYMHRMHSLTHEMRQSEQELQTFYQESLHHALVVKTLERIDLILRTVDSQQRHLRGIVRKRALYSTTSLGVLNAGFGIGYLVAFGWGVFHLEAGTITYGAMLAFVQLVGQIQSPVRTLTHFVPVLIGSVTAAERLLEIEKLPDEIAEASSENQKAPKKIYKAPKKNQKASKKIYKPSGENHEPSGAEHEEWSEISFQHVAFSYTPTSRRVLTDFTFSFPAGSRTAIVGETGCGKTTLVRLLLALVAPTEGTVGIRFGADGREEALSPCHRHLFSYVPQGNTLLTGTIRSNLQLGDPDATDAAMWEAIDASAADFVHTLPDGLDTQVGEGAGGLSEGQAQRIAIARALLREAPILLLDEATSALDPQTERRVLEQMTRRPHTLIYITHRPEAITFATQTLRLER